MYVKLVQGMYVNIKFNSYWLTVCQALQQLTHVDPGAHKTVSLNKMDSSCVCIKLCVRSQSVVDMNQYLHVSTKATIRTL
jgi:hypothetical protein